jgi:DNA-binding NarL/FixJ family response regulator
VARFDLHPRTAVIRVLVINEHRAVRDAIERLLHAVPDMICVGTGADGSDAVVLGGEHLPDVVVLDISRLDSHAAGASVGTLRRRSESAIITMADWDYELRRMRSLAAGAFAHLVDDCDPDVLLGAIREAAAGAAAA